MSMSTSMSLSPSPLPVIYDAKRQEFSVMVSDSSSQSTSFAQTQAKTEGCYQKYVRYVYSHTSRTGRNLTRVFFAAAFSMLGAIIGGDPRAAAALGLTLTAAVAFGGFLGGFGNGLSTWLAWETETEDRIKFLEEAFKAMTEERKEFMGKVSALADENRKIMGRVSALEATSNLLDLSLDMV